MLVWTMTSTPIGDLMLMGTRAGLVRVAFSCEGVDAVRTSVGLALGEEPIEDDTQLAGAASEIEEFFSGERTAFDLRLDWSLARGFHAEVERLLETIPYGRTLSYSELAERAGRPRAHRAAASACARNPLPILAPCHRVTRRDGSLGGYLGGTDAKRWLLDFEAEHVIGPAPLP